MARAGRRLAQRRIVRNAVDPEIPRRVIGLAPAVRIPGNVGGLQNGARSRVLRTHAAIEHAAYGVHARCAQIVQEVATPVVRALFPVASGRCLRGHENTLGIAVADVVVEVAVVVDLVRLVPDIDHTVAVEVGGIVVGLVVQLVVTPHHQHVQGRQRLVHEQRHLGQHGVRAPLGMRRRTGQCQCARPQRQGRPRACPALARPRAMPGFPTCNASH